MVRNLLWGLAALYASATPLLACPPFPPPEVEHVGGPMAMASLGPNREVPSLTRHVAPPVGSLGSTRIFLRRGGCFGDCPIYQVTIGGDGTVQYRGEKFVLVPGRHTAKIDPEAVRCLVEDFKAADFWSLAPQYVASVTDSSPYTISITIGGRSKTTLDYVGGVVGMPKEVKALEDEIDLIAGDQWVRGNSKTIPALKAEGFDFHSAKAAEMLRQAVEASSDEIVLALLSEGAQVRERRGSKDTYGRSIFETAANRETSVVLEAFFDHGEIDRHQAGDALIQAANQGRLGVVQAILKHPVDVNRRGANGTTALIEASDGADRDGAKRHEEILRLVDILLAAGADPRLRKTDGWSVLHGADSLELAQRLIAAGADVNAMNKDRHTPLSLAQDDNRALLLLQAGANPGVQMYEGGTLPDKARKEGWTGTLAWLAKHPSQAR